MRLRVPLPVILGIVLVTAGVVLLAMLPGCATTTAQAGLIDGQTRRMRLVAPRPRVALAAAEPVYAVFDGTLCTMVNGRWIPQPGAKWGTHTVCESTDSNGNVRVDDFIREAK